MLKNSVYLEYYGLSEPPFAITPNPRFLFYSAKHREAFNHLLYGIRERKGFVQLTGEVGAGKTTLCRAMLEQLDGRYATALILNPVMSAGELVKAIAVEFGPSGITANTIAPGIIETTRDPAHYPDFAAEYEKRRQAMPVRRLGRGEDVAQACLYLCSEAGGFVTGQVMHVNGGEFIA